MKLTQKLASTLTVSNKITKIFFFLIVSFSITSLVYAGMGTHLEHHKHRQAKTIGLKDFHAYLTYTYEYEEEINPHTITRTQGTDLFLTYGLLSWIDIEADIPLKYRTVNGKKTYSGMDDMTFAGKVKLYNKNGLSFAVAPFIVFPNHHGYKEGIGEGRIQSGLSVFTTYEKDPISVTLMGVYKRNENIVNDRVDIWKVYLMPSWNITDKFTFMTSIGVERDTNKKNPNNPIFLSGGFKYSVTKIISIVPSVKIAFQKEERDITVLLGTHLDF